jgi:ribonuclease J
VSLLDVVPLGGVGEFGMNMMAITSGETTVLVDAGAMFPGPEHLGIDLIVPDLSYLEQTEQQVDALVLTHGHEDHIGAVPYVWERLSGSVYGTPLALALLEAKLEEHQIDATDRLVTIAPGQRVDVGSVEIEFLRVTHSMPDCVAVALHTPVGTLVHTGDFKVDQTPLDGERFDTHRLAQLGENGVLALFGDSTNIARPGHAGSERDVIGAFEEIFVSTQGMLVVTAFASSLHRIQVLVDLAARFGRKVALIGRSVQQNAAIAQRLGCLTIPDGAQIRDRDVASHPRGQVLCIVTGSQGAPRAALTRIAVDAHRYVKLKPDDVVVFSARAIPGNQRAIGRLMDHIVRRGATIIDEDAKPVHVSGHASEEELKLMLSLVRPRYFVPIHGEYRYLVRHGRLAERVTDGRTAVLVIENGDRLGFDTETAWIKDTVPAGRVLIDGSRTGEVVDEVLRDRRHLAGDGVVVLVIAMNRHDGGIEGDATVTTRGFVVDDRTDILLREVPGVVRSAIEATSFEERTDRGLVQEHVRGELQRFFRKRSGRRPLVLPVILEI